MILFIRLLRESYLFAFQSIIVNKLRTILSLLGITIGIFAVITVFTIVDSMEVTIRKNIESLGNNVLFIQKWPWDFSNDYPWWKYFNRPEVRYSEMNELVKRTNSIEAVAFMISTSKNIKYLDRSVDNVSVSGVSHDYEKVFSVKLKDGRYFTPMESASGRNVVIIGSNVADNLFGTTDPVGKDVKIFGRKVEVVGVLEKEGEDMFGNNPDDQAMIPINYARNIIDITNEYYSPLLVAKAKPNYSNAQVRDDLTGAMRSIRRLKPGSEDNFSINEADILSKGFDSIFSVISIAGWIIGGFSLLVGGFGIANIMFVSVRERTNIIGIQKSLGAKKYFILFEFLFEAIMLCIVGGLLGLLLVYIGTLIVSAGFEMDLSLTLGNIMLGLSVSAIIGLISGYIPAYMASKLDPVVAIRTGN
ncbi:MAG TPA: ABC transporter permease [Bacteroidales bacterium]|nr:ABC transporter permease [Bacteroidales bacterium]